MAIEDFTTFTEVDGGSDLTVTSSKIDVVAQPNNVANYVYKSKSVGTSNFDWDFEHNVTALTGSNPDAFFVALSDQIAELNNGFSLSTSFDSNNYTPYVSDVDDLGNFDAFTAGSNLTTNTFYYSSFSRSGNTAVWDVYSNSGRTTLVQSISLSISNTTASYQYAYGTSAYNWGDTSTATYFVQNLDYKEAAGGATGKSNPLMGCFGGSLSGAIA